MGNASSSEKAVGAAGLLQSILADDLSAISGALLQHPWLLDEVLEAESGHKIFHVAVLQSKHTILAYLCAYATIGRSVFFCEHFYPVAGLAFCATL